MMFHPMMTIPSTPENDKAQPRPQLVKPMTRTKAYSTVGKTVGLKTYKVKEVVDAMMELAVQQLNSVGTVKIVGAIIIRLKKNLQGLQ